MLVLVEELLPPKPVKLPPVAELSLTVPVADMVLLVLLVKLTVVGFCAPQG